MALNCEDRNAAFLPVAEDGAASGDIDGALAGVDPLIAATTGAGTTQGDPDRMVWIRLAHAAESGC